MEMNISKQVDALKELLEGKKAEEVVDIHVGDRTIIADYFVICTGHSTTHVKALCDEVEEQLDTLGLDLRRTEGYPEGRWIVMDFASIILHIFCPEERQYYNMERLWRDARTAAAES